VLTESLIEVAADLSFALDLFERNRERELEQQQLRLQHSALEAAANAIVITDRAGTIQWVNDAFTRLTAMRAPKPSAATRGCSSRAHTTPDVPAPWQTVLAATFGKAR